MTDKIKVIIVDDSASVRQVLSDVLSSDKSIEVLTAASDPIIAMKYMEKEWPDVIISDIAMPRKDGLTFVREIMSIRPTPVIICSALTEENADISLEAMAAGAVTVISKPRIGARDFLHDSALLLIESVKSAATANVKNFNLKRTVKKIETQKAALSSQQQKKIPHDVAEKIIAIGASAGGTQAIETILMSLPDDLPGIVIVQHMPEKFTEAFAKRLNSFCVLTVKEAEDNETIKRGVALIAPGNFHLTIKKNVNSYIASVKIGPLISRHRPSVDVLFRSVAQNASSNSLGIILTGMGDDGAIGLSEMKAAGAKTIAQDKKTSIVFGMPAEAIKKGCVDKVVPLDDIHKEIIIFSKYK
ncbi:MAG: chemotaxis response regulator protein-glutamate methylesterase [Spirochaetota bacterium]